MSPALQGGFLTAGPPGKSLSFSVDGPLFYFSRCAAERWDIVSEGKKCYVLNQRQERVDKQRGSQVGEALALSVTH